MPRAFVKAAAKELGVVLVQKRPFESGEDEWDDYKNTYHYDGNLMRPWHARCGVQSVSQSVSTTLLRL